MCELPHTWRDAEVQSAIRDAGYSATAFSLIHRIELGSKRYVAKLRKDGGSLEHEVRGTMAAQTAGVHVPEILHVSTDRSCYVMRHVGDRTEDDVANIASVLALLHEHAEVPPLDRLVSPDVLPPAASESEEYPSFFRGRVSKVIEHFWDLAQGDPRNGRGTLEGIHKVIDEVIDWLS